MAVLSRLAYAEHDAIVKWIAANQYDCRYLMISVQNHQAVIFFFDRLTVVAFRGTEFDYEDILTDLKITRDRLERCSLGSVHSGFNAGAIALADPIRNALEKYRHRGPLYFTGHSLGGALAQLVQWRLSHEDDIATYSFGSPRVGDGLYALNYGSRYQHFRIVNASDIVPNVPPSTLGYEHGGSWYYITSGGEMITWPNFFRQLADQWWDVAKGLADGLTGGIPVRRFTRHRINEYVDRLAALAVANG
ncbi:lipase family protein [Sneathiella sp.]|uniref:lipase family protein n=1 Tax=Sneathiella sp. TaxID=1964365 RepID=UPI002FE15B9D